MSLRLHPAIFFLVIGIAFTLLLEGCKGGGSGGGNGATPRPPGTVSGTAFDGLVRNGTVNVWSFNGTSGAHLGSGTTDNEGHYSLSITAESQPVLIEVTGGTYTEEASGKTVTLNAQANKLLAVANYTSGKALSTSVTYYTTLATGLAQYLIKSGMPVAQAVSKANTRMGELAGVNIANVVPVDITSISSAKPSLDDALRYSFATAAISELTKQQSLKAYPTENVHERHTSIGWVTLAYHDIVYDGVLNGKGAAGTISIGSIPITTKMYRHDTAIAMLVIASSTNNKTSIKVSELRSDAARFAQSTDVIFDGATPPPFLDGAGAGPKITLSFSKPLTGNVDVVPQIALLDDVRLDSAKLTIGSVDFGSAANPANVKWSADTTQVTDGTHTLKIVVADAIGRTTTFQTSVTVSNGKIVISQSPAADSAVRGTIPFVFTPRTATGLSITGVSISTSAIGTVALSANGDGTWRYDLNSQVFSDGKQSFTVRANDSAGRHTTVTFDLFVDNTAPTITHTIPSGFTSGDLAATIGITETNLANASYKLDGQNAVALKVGDNAVNIPAGTLNGTQKLTIEATDKAGNLTRVTHNFNADNTAPVITHTAPSGYTAGDLRFTITVTETNLDKASYAIGNARPVSLNTGSNAITVSKGDLSDGTHTLVIEASDKAGATAKVTHTLLVDNVAPKIAHTAPSGYTSGDITFTITVTETNLDKATYKIGTGNDIALNAGSNTITLSKGTLIDGDHTLTMTATDKAGTKTTVTHTLKVDNNAPTIAHTAPSAYTAGAIAFTITVTEDYLDKASYTIGSRSAVNLKAGANNVTLSAGTLADGSHTLTITATDKAGAKTTATHTLNVDNTRPVVSTNLSAAWQRGSIQLVTTITESHLTSATVTIDGTLIGKAVAGKNRVYHQHDSL